MFLNLSCKIAYFFAERRLQNKHSGRCRVTRHQLREKSFIVLVPLRFPQKFWAGAEGSDAVRDIERRTDVTSSSSSARGHPWTSWRRRFASWARWRATWQSSAPAKINWTFYQTNKSWIFLGLSKAKVNFKDRKDGSCHVSYTVEEPGEYSIGIRFNDTHIQDHLTR